MTVLGLIYTHILYSVPSYGRFANASPCLIAR